MVSDVERFRPKMGKIDVEGRSLSVKHDLYRLPNTLFNQLALYFGLKAHSVWEQIKELTVDTVGHPALITSDALARLQWAIDSISYHRLRAYLSLREQAEEACLSADSSQVRSYGGNYQRFYELPTQEVLDIYYCLIPLWHASRSFRDSAGECSAFQADYPELYSNSSLVKGQIKQLLQGHHQALADFEDAVTKARQLVKAKAEGVKNPAQKEGLSLENKDPQATTGKISGALSVATRDLARALQAQGTAQYELRHYVPAESSLREAVKLFQEQALKEPTELSECLRTLALVLKPQGKAQLEEAHRYAQEALRLVEIYYGKHHPYFARCEAVKGELASAFRHLVQGWHVPQSHNDSFIGREALFKQLAERFEASSAGQRVVLSAVSGLGGVGKTHLAIHYLHRTQQAYELRAWFRAESATTLLADYQEFAYEKGLMKQSDKFDKQKVIELVKQFLEKHSQWLAVYDNVENYEEIRAFLPTKGGHVLLTTRRHEWPAQWPKEQTVGWGRVEVDVFTAEEALDYLKKFTGRSGVEEEASMKALAEELGRLPLALAQAAAYIKRRVVSVTDYRDRYRQSKRELLADKLLPAYSESLPVATTWDVSLAQILREEKINHSGLYLMARLPQEHESLQKFKNAYIVTEKPLGCYYLDEKSQAHELKAENKNIQDLLKELKFFDESKEEKGNTIISLKELLTQAQIKYFREWLLLHGSQIGVAENPENSVTWNLLQAISCLHSEDIPYSLLERWLQETQWAKDAIEAKKQLTEALNYLQDYSLIQRSSDRQTLSLHRLVQDAMRDRFNPNLREVKRKEKRKHAVLETKETKSELEEKTVAREAITAAYDGRVQYKAGNLEEAKKHITTAIKGFEHYGNSCASDLSKCYLDLALVLAQQNQINEAQKRVQKAREYLNSYGAAHPLMARCAHVEHYIKTSLALGKRMLASWPSALPLGSAYFIGREKPLVALAKHFQPRYAHQQTSRTVLLGIDGIGKTALAAHYLHHAHYEYDLRIWFRAEDAATLLRDYRAFAKEFGLLSSDVKDETSESLVIDAVKAYLESYPDWLVIYDNAGSYADLKEFLPTQGGHMVITTCRREWQDIAIANTLELEVLEELEAVSYLSQLLSDKPVSEEQEALVKVVQSVGCFPLALSHIGEAIKAKRLSLNTVTKEAIEQEILKPLALAWKAHFETIVHEEKERGDKSLSLPLLCHVMERGVSEKNFIMMPRMEVENWFIEQKISKSPTEAKKDLDKVISCLSDYLLISIDVTHEKLGIPIIMRIWRNDLLSASGTMSAFSDNLADESKLQEATFGPLSIMDLIKGFNLPKIVLSLAASSINECNTKTQVLEDERRQKRLLPHLQALVKYYESFKFAVYRPDILGGLLGNIGYILMKLEGNVPQAKQFLERAVKVEENCYGSNHKQVAMTLNNLANAYISLGEVENARPLLERALKIQEAYYGTEHWEVARTLNTLAATYSNSEHLSKKKQLLERALRIYEAYYGPNDWRVAVVLNNLGNVHSNLGEVQTAKSCYKKVLQIFKDHYGAEHGEVAKVLNGLASVEDDQKVKRELLERAIKIQEKFYGTDHWEMTTNLSDLASVYSKSGDVKNKKLLLERTLKIQESHYGINHFKILGTLSDLAITFCELGDMKRAKLLLERVVKIHESWYGKNHWQIVPALVNLAKIYGDLGDTKHKKTLLEQALKIQENHQSADPIALVTILHELGNAYDSLNNPKTGKIVLERALGILEAQYGKDHWGLASTLNDLSLVYRNLNDVKGEVRLLERALKLKEMHYGVDHWQVARTLDNLVNAYGCLKDIKTAQAASERALKINEAHYGANHSQVAISLLGLAKVYYSLSELSKARAIAQRAYDIFCKNSDPTAQEALILLQYIDRLSLSHQMPTVQGASRQIFDRNAIIGQFCNPQILTLLQQQKEIDVRLIFNERGIDFDDPEVHYMITNLYSEQQNLRGAICHSEIALNLMQVMNQSPQSQASIHHNLACYYHCYAQQQQVSRNHLGAKDAFAQAAHHFEQGIKLAAQVAIHTEYANFLLRQQRTADAIQQLESALKLGQASVQEVPRLGYSGLERLTLDSHMQDELDCWRQINIKAINFAHYLLITAYIQKSDQSASKSVLASFQKLAEKENDALIFSLLGHLYQEIGNYEAAINSYQRAVKLKPDYLLAKQRLDSSTQHSKFAPGDAKSKSSSAVSDQSPRLETKTTPEPLGFSLQDNRSSTFFSPAKVSEQKSATVEVKTAGESCREALKLQLQGDHVNALLKLKAVLTLPDMDKDFSYTSTDKILLDEVLQQEITSDGTLSIAIKLLTYYYLIKCCLASEDDEMCTHYLGELEAYVATRMEDKVLAEKVLEYVNLAIIKKATTKESLPTNS